jgi:hypothetical protein
MCIGTAVSSDDTQCFNFVFSLMMAHRGPKHVRDDDDDDMVTDYQSFCFLPDDGTQRAKTCKR